MLGTSLGTRNDARPYAITTNPFIALPEKCFTVASKESSYEHRFDGKKCLMARYTSFMRLLLPLPQVSSSCRWNGPKADSKYTISYAGAIFP